MRQEHKHYSKLSDGTILRKLLNARVTKDDTSKSIWSAHLNLNQSKVFRWLKKSYNGRIVQVLKSLLPMPVDWDSVTFGGISRIILTYCHEVSRSRYRLSKGSNTALGTSLLLASTS